MRVDISDRSYTALRAVGRKTRRAQETVYSFKLLRAGFEPFRACATPTGYIDPSCGQHGKSTLIEVAHSRARLKTGAREFRQSDEPWGAPTFSPYQPLELLELLNSFV